jgi:hypothetical protein
MSVFRVTARYVSMAAVRRPDSFDSAPDPSLHPARIHPAPIVSIDFAPLVAPASPAALRFTHDASGPRLDFPHAPD